MYPWLVIGISGVTNGGKTSLTFRLRDLLIQHFRSRKQNVNVLTISQDDFFLKPDDPRHVLLPSLGHFNWDIPTAVDFSALYESVLKIIGDSPEEKGKEFPVTENKKPLNTRNILRGILLIEGFLIFNYQPTSSLCHLKYYMVLSRAVCLARRLQRCYDPPDVPGYFEQCVWPEHVKHRTEILGKGVIVDESDPLTMDEVRKYTKAEGNDSASGIQKAAIDKSPCPSSELVTNTKDMPKNETEMLMEEKEKSSCEDFYMKVGGDVLSLTKFGAAGLGVVNNINVLNGCSLDRETLAQLVLRDVLNEIAGEEEATEVTPGINNDK